MFCRSQDGKDPSKIWYGLQWFSTGFLWCMWLVQDLANIFVFLPRQLDLVPMLICTLVLCVGLCVLVATGGGPIQAVLRTKTNSSDLRSATLIDLLFGLCLLYKAFLSSFPLSTTWVFLGLIGGRELALRIKQHTSDLPFTNRRTARFTGHRHHRQPLHVSAVIKAAEANARAGTGRKALERNRGPAPFLRRWLFFRRGTPAIGNQVAIRLEDGLPGTELRLRPGKGRTAHQPGQQQ